MTMATESILDECRQKVEDELKQAISLLGPPSSLRDACEYALSSGGKRYRPIITFLVADALGALAPVAPAALAVEFFHTASLVADDLPCMDDDDERRNAPSTHRKHGEAVALLVSYGLIAAGYENLARNAALLKNAGLSHSPHSDRICVIALENATQNTGFSGATGGQFMDIFPPDLSLPTIRDVIHKKTVSLFEVAFVLGWAYGGGALDRLDQVKILASHYGMAFQIADDLGDVEQDVLNGRKVNMATAAGKERAIEVFHAEICAYKLMLKELRIETSYLVYLAQSLEEKIKELKK